jgi:heat shock protein HslJ
MEEERPQTMTIALVVVGVIVAGLLLFAFLNRGSDNGSLTGRTWQLAAITGKTPAFQGVIPAAEQPLYTIAFSTDGTFVARADCNALSGTYALRRVDGITITAGPSTLVACPDGSYGSLFAHSLSTVTTWEVTGGELTLTTTDDGTGTFVDAATAPAVPTPTPTPSPSPTPSASPTPSPSPTPTPSPSPTPSPTPSPSPTATASASAGPTATPTATPTPAPTPTPTPKPTPAPTPSPTPAPTPPPGGDLVGTNWQLTAFTTRDPAASGDVPAAERFKYTASFAQGGSFSATADCNTLLGTWTATATGGLAIVPGASSIVLCGEGSYSDVYILALTNSASYAIANDVLTITLEDGGTLVYEPAN